MLNDQFRKLNKDIAAIMQGAREAGTDEAAKQAYAKYEAMLDSTMNANTDNALGYFIFLNGKAQQMDAASEKHSRSIRRLPHINAHRVFWRRPKNAKLLSRATNMSISLLLSPTVKL